MSGKIEIKNMYLPGYLISFKYLDKLKTSFLISSLVCELAKYSKSFVSKNVLLCILTSLKSDSALNSKLLSIIWVSTLGEFNAG